MTNALVHFEVFVRRRPNAPWSLALATEDRKSAFEAADATARNVSVRLFKETLDPETGDFRPLILLERGHVREPKPKSWRARRAASAARARARPATASCTRPQDLYASPARETIGRVLGGWLQRHRVTPFELLHRPDLAERLEACEAELSAALYNAALGEAAARGAALEPVRRSLADLVRRTIERLHSDEPDAGFRLGSAVASRLGRHPNWKDKLELLLEMFEAAPASGEPAHVSLRILAQPLTDILGAQGDLGEIFGPGALGDHLLVLIQIASAPAIAAAADVGLIGRMTPRLKGLAASLALLLHGRAVLVRTRRAIIRRVIAALSSNDRLWPDDPVREVEGLIALSALLKLSGRLIDVDEAAITLAARWRRLADSRFLDERLGACRGALEEAQVVLDLIEAANGYGAIEALGRRLLAVLADPCFEQEARYSPDPLAMSLSRLASLAARVQSAPLRLETRVEAQGRLRRIAADIEADVAAYCA